MAITPEQASRMIVSTTPQACEALNQFAADVFRTRGGRIGSGMGSVIEALWGFFLNKSLDEASAKEISLAWIYGHEYNDFACTLANVEWRPEDRHGELLRIEAKSMVASADESKAHFDRLVCEMDASELLAVFLWDWVSIDEGQRTVSPQIKDFFVGSALEVARLRDALHLQRGGSFVAQVSCPDGCAPTKCPHIGEPLNAAGVRERRTGPMRSRGRGVSYAANFGGLLRMLGVRSAAGRAALEEIRLQSPTAADFIEFMARNFPRVRRNLTTL